jgi:peptidoglycan/xylan/chitin deacetylase (PgdA/CDA1 family)
MVLKGVASLLAPGGPRGRLSILIFHRVLPQADPLFPDEPDGRRFDDVLSWISRWFNVIALDDAVAQMRAGTLPARAAAITFDDGYADNATVALPILQRHGMTATFFIATSFLNGGRMWNDTIIESVRSFSGSTLDLRDEGLGIYRLESHGLRRAAINALLDKIKYLQPAHRADTVSRFARQVAGHLPGDLMMTSEQVIQLRQAGMQIGAHTQTHPILASVPELVAAEEIIGSKVALESLLDEPVTLFAYPNGKPDKDYMGLHTQLVRQAGFEAAVSTAPGVSTVASDRFQLPRFSPWDTSRSRYGLRMIANLRLTQPVLAQA